MALTACPECKTQISTKAAACPQCGFPLGAAEPVSERERVPLRTGVPLRECPACRALTDARAWVCQTCSRRIGPAPGTEEAKAEVQRIADIKAMANRGMRWTIGIIMLIGIVLIILFSGTGKGGRR
jgi:RNA polymerase subunit RPABC4/transcription elongation factor Spt4